MFIGLWTPRGLQSQRLGSICASFFMDVVNEAQKLLVETEL